VDQQYQQVGLDVLGVVDARGQLGALDVPLIPGLRPGPLAVGLLVLLEVVGQQRRLLLAVRADLLAGHDGRVGHLPDQRQRPGTDETADLDQLLVGQLGGVQLGDAELTLHAGDELLDRLQY